MNNAKGWLPRLPFYLFIAAVLTACGGGGGGGDSGGGGGDDIVRPQCQAPAPLALGSTKYGFWFPSVDLSNGQITLIDADNLGSKQKLSSHGTAVAGSVAVAQEGAFVKADGNGNPPVANELKPAMLVYASKDDGNIYRVDLDKNGSGTNPVPLTTNAKISEVCDTSIVTVNIGDASSDYYLYSVPESGKSCNTGDSPQNPAYLVHIGATAPQSPSSVLNAKLVETLAKPTDGTLASIIALDDKGHLNAYDPLYSNAQPVIPDTVTAATDLYHALNIAFIGATPTKGDTEIVRVEVKSDGSLMPPGTLTLLGERLTAATADADNLYYALRSGSGYSIARVALDDPDVKPTSVLTVTGSDDRIFDLHVSGQRLVFVLVSGSETVGTLYSIDKSGSGSMQRLDNDVTFGEPYPLYAANGHLYYTVVSNGELRARIATDTGSLINDYERSAWFSSLLPQDRAAGSVDPAQVLLAAGYTGSGQTMSGAVLDSFPTDGNSCVTFDKAVGGQPAVVRRFNSLGTGIVSDGNDQARFAFDASDGRFVTVP